MAPAGPPDPADARIVEAWMPMTNGHDGQARYLAVYVTTGSHKQAVKACGHHYTTAWRWRTENPAFQEALESARQMLVDSLEDKAIEIALNGSEQMLRFLLKSLRKDLYGPGSLAQGRESVKIELVADDDQAKEMP